MTAQLILGSLAFLSLVLLLWQWIAGRRGGVRSAIDPIRFHPSVSLLKPVRGADSETRACLESWQQQVYPGELEILFGVESDDTDALTLVESLIGDRGRLIVIDELAGANAKVCKLAALAAEATNKVICVSDADTHVAPEFLAQLVKPLADDQIGLVNSLYSLANPTGAAMWWEAIGVNADFWSQVLQSNSMKRMDFALGAAIALRRGVLDEIGGFESVIDHLADDYQLGQLVTRAGYRIELVPLVAECRDPEFGWRQAWQHQLRWARTIRACQPLPYFTSILNNTTLWLLLWLVVAVQPAGAIIGSGLLIRLLVASDLMRRLTGNSRHLTWLWMVWIKDILGALIWLGAFCSNTVQWRGDSFQILPDGRLRKLKSATTEPDRSAFQDRPC